MFTNADGRAVRARRTAYADICARTSITRKPNADVPAHRQPSCYDRTEHNPPRRLRQPHRSAAPTMATDRRPSAAAGATRPKCDAHETRPQPTTPLRYAVGCSGPGTLESAKPLAALVVSFYTVSRPLELSLQSSLQLSLTVLVCYRSCGHI